MGIRGRSVAHRPVSSGESLVRSPITGAVGDRGSLREVGGWEDDIRWVTGRGPQPGRNRLWESAATVCNLKTLVTSEAGLRRLVLRFLCRNQRWTARSLGDGARRTWSALHHCLIGTPVPTASSRNKCAGKLRKIKHLQRERGRNHYRGQKRARGCFCSQGAVGSCRVARAGR